MVALLKLLLVLYCIGKRNIYGGNNILLVFLCQRNENDTLLTTDFGNSLDVCNVVIIRNLFYGYTQLGHKPKKGTTCPIPEEPGYYYTTF
jgi:hypothetical protein